MQWLKRGHMASKMLRILRRSALGDIKVPVEVFSLHRQAKPLSSRSGRDIRVVYHGRIRLVLRWQDLEHAQRLPRCMHVTFPWRGVYVNGRYEGSAVSLRVQPRPVGFTLPCLGNLSQYVAPGPADDQKGKYDIRWSFQGLLG
jgi:hypothetical protein